ncbi:head maturation protease, ClpP-related [Eubacterium sp.]|uniref:head maturation protease, ClpP-related n=1 Tax=Eubacterium sp. TaxID=142586 RepID=UPI0026E0731D|nr:head maturation protease, ClpP-related [Eubacterium sp.]MDO5433330.1 Clp protease ClpP [Eubacterium sp.]
MKKYYALESEGDHATINIFGDITSWPWLESDVSSYNLVQELDALQDTDRIDVYINSYGGEVAEGLAIYSALKRHKAKVVTHCEGFACSVASVIFMAGDERVMSNASLLMIHNAWTYTQGNAKELRKEADDLDTITQASKNAYLERINIDETELSAMMDSEKWLDPAECLEKGFATAIVGDGSSGKPSQHAKQAVYNAMRKMAPAVSPVEKAGPESEPAAVQMAAMPEEPPEDPPEKEETENKVFNFITAIFGDKEE